MGPQDAVTVTLDALRLAPRHLELYEQGASPGDQKQAVRPAALPLEVELEREYAERQRCVDDLLLNRRFTKIHTALPR